MSSYENYSKASRRYDATRVPVGVEIITGCLAQDKAPLAQQYLLDAGCGTGNYSTWGCWPMSGRISAVDINDGMLSRAREKLVAECDRGRIDFHQASIDSLPFEDAVFDGIMVNQVLHHLELAADADYPVYRKVFAEFARVLKPGGGVVVNTCSPEQFAPWILVLPPDSRRDRAYVRPPRPAGCSAADHGRRRPRLPAVLRAGGCPDARGRLLQPPRTAGQILARRRFDVEHGIGQNHRCGLRPPAQTGSIRETGKLPPQPRRQTPTHRPVFVFVWAT